MPTKVDEEAVPLTPVEAAKAEAEKPKEVSQVPPVTSGYHPDFVPTGDVIVPKSSGKFGEPWPYHDDDYDGYPGGIEDENADPANLKAAAESIAAAENVLGPFTGTTTKKTNDDDPHPSPSKPQAGAKTKSTK